MCIVTNKIKVFLIPYAGASAYAYYKWKNVFEHPFEACFLELAGRGSRSGHDFYNDIYEAADDISNYIAENIDNNDYIIYGHSMGSLVTFEVYYKLLEKGVRLPIHLFFSGKDAPHIDYHRDKIYQYSDDKFLEMVSLYGGIPQEFYQEDIKKLFLPILKADFKLQGEYIYCEKPEKIRCDMTVLYGERDFSTRLSEIENWKFHAGGDFHAYIFKGDHFFINQEYPDIIKLIEKSVFYANAV